MSTFRAGRGRLLTAVAGPAVAALPAFLVATLAPHVERSLGCGARGVGGLVAAFYLGAALGGVPAGRLAERLGGAYAIVLSGALSGTCLEVVGLFGHSLFLFGLLLAVGGTCSSLMAAGVNKRLASSTRPERLGAMLGVRQAAPPIAVLVAGVALPSLSGVVGWRGSVMAAGGMSLLPVGAALLAANGERSDGRARRRVALAPGSHVGLWWLSVAFGLGVCGATGITTFLVEAATDSGMSLRDAGMLVALAGGAAAVARIVMGTVADRYRGSPLVLVSRMLLVGGGGCGMMLVGASRPAGWLVGVGAMLSLGVGWGWNGLLMFEVLRSNVRAAGHATGVMQVGGRLGNLLGPLLFALVIRKAFFGYAWLLAGGFMWATSIVVWRVRLGRQDEEPRWRADSRDVQAI